MTKLNQILSLCLLRRSGIFIGKQHRKHKIACYIFGFKKIYSIDFDISTFKFVRSDKSIRKRVQYSINVILAVFFSQEPNCCIFKSGHFNSSSVLDTNRRHLTTTYNSFTLLNKNPAFPVFRFRKTIHCISVLQNCMLKSQSGFR